MVNIAPIYGDDWGMVYYCLTTLYTYIMEYYGNNINGVWKMIEARPGYLHMSINATWMAPFCL